MPNRASASRAMVVAVCALLLIGLAFWGWHAFHRPPASPSTSGNITNDSLLATGRGPANIRGAVLYDSYDHARENVPPRNDTRARANQWQAPPMPQDLIRTAAAEKAASSETELIEFLTRWEGGYRVGKHIQPQDGSKLTSLLEHTHLSFETLFNLGSLMAFLENPTTAAIFHRAALRRANEDYKDLSPLHPAAPMLRAALPQMGMYWNSDNYDLLEQRFKIEMQLYPPLSQEGRKCAHSCAEAMFYQGHSREAADLMVTKVQSDEQAGDLTTSDKQEMGWIVGIFYGPDRNKEAIAGLAVAAQSGGGRATNAIQVMAQKISQLPPDQIEQQLAALEKYRMSQEQIEKVRMRVNNAVAARRPPTPEEQKRIEKLWEERRAFEAARAQSTTRPTTRPLLTTQQAALLQAARAAVATSRPTTRGTIPTSAQVDAARQEQQRQYQLMVEQQRDLASRAADTMVLEIRMLFKANPRQAIDLLLNRNGMGTLLMARRYDDMNELGIAAIILAARDTWQVEQLQRFRVVALSSAGKAKEALSAARANFDVAGMGSASYDISKIAQHLGVTYISDAAIANRFRLQQLAGAQSDPEQRKKAMANLGENVMSAIEVDPSPFAQAVKDRQSATDYDTLYSLGNLLLISGRVKEARDVFDRVYQTAPPGEINYASEAIAKVIKAEDGNIGRANEFAASIRPKE